MFNRRRINAVRPSFAHTASAKLGLAVLFLSLGCGNGPYVSNSANAKPTISAQPQSTEVPLDGFGGFSVQASGGGLHYLWLRNGVALPSHDSNSLNVGPTAMTDDGSLYSVRVSNDLGVAESSPASLSIGARAPKQGDIRFKGVDSVYISPGYVASVSSNLVQGISKSFANSLLSPLLVGPGTCSSTGCSWEYQIFQGPTGYDSSGFLISGALSDLNAQIQGLGTNGVMTSLDIDKQSQSYGLAAQSGSAVAFVQGSALWTTTELAAAAKALGQGGKVVTSIAPQDDKNLVLFYGSSLDGVGTSYDAIAVNVSPSEVVSQITTLANTGYLVTAVGHLTDGTFEVVGSKLTGDTKPRRILIATSSPTSSGASQLLTMHEKGYAIVAFLYNSSDHSTTWVGER